MHGYLLNNGDERRTPYSALRDPKTARTFLDALPLSTHLIQKPLRTFWDALPLSTHLIQKPLRTFWDALPLPAIDRSKLVEAQSEKHAHANSLFTCE
ncbi:hypothetical protein L3V16_05910 [Brucella ciceri]|uniref:hypothetical protein n=1 Tax=Brucella TaxID=234 RepID=UPI001F14957B|nr:MULTISPECIES: hypothetical protein [Brucella]MCH6203374.1 hypothetical protein [Brucella ciceri]MDL2202749.1 hypothetical protein [Brucella intermedia]